MQWVRYGTLYNTTAAGRCQHAARVIKIADADVYIQTHVHTHTPNTHTHPQRSKLVVRQIRCICTPPLQRSVPYCIDMRHGTGIKYYMSIKYYNIYISVYSRVIKWPEVICVLSAGATFCNISISKQVRTGQVYSPIVGTIFDIHLRYSRLDHSDRTHVSSVLSLYLYTFSFLNDPSAQSTQMS